MSRYYISTIGTYPNHEPFAVINDNKLREVVATGTLADCMIQLYALRAGEKKLNKPKDKLKELNDLYIRKNQDYGDSFGLSIKKYGDVAYFVRAEDKLNRLESLLFGKNKQQVKDESIQDTLDDLLNYTIMYGMILSEKKHEQFNSLCNEQKHEIVGGLIIKRYVKLPDKIETIERFNDLVIRHNALGVSEDVEIIQVINLCVSILNLMDKV